MLTLIIDVTFYDATNLAEHSQTCQLNFASDENLSRSDSLDYTSPTACVLLSANAMLSVGHFQSRLAKRSLPKSEL